MKPTATVDSLTQITVTWDAPDDGGSDIIGYMLRYGRVNTDEQTTLTLTGTGRTRTLTNLVSGAVYEVEVAATNDVGTGPWSSTALPDASISVSIDAVPDGDQGEGVTLSASVTGAYDTITYEWTASHGTLSGATNTATPTWARPISSVDLTVTLEVTVTAHGTGSGAQNGTSDTATESSSLLVPREVYGPYIRNNDTILIWNDWLATNSFRGSGADEERQWTRTGTRSGTETSTSNYGNTMTRPWSETVSEAPWFSTQLPELPVIDTHFRETSRFLSDSRWRFEFEWILWPNVYDAPGEIQAQVFIGSRSPSDTQWESWATITWDGTDELPERIQRLTIDVGEHSFGSYRVRTTNLNGTSDWVSRPWNIRN